jgi:hypothetical protein
MAEGRAVDCPSSSKSWSRKASTQGLRKGVESVALLAKLAELGTHLAEGAVPVAGAVLELLPPTDRNQ